MHYGRQADGSPLTRNSALKHDNREASCPQSRPRPEGKSCDEYPFASTDQGGSKVAPPNSGWAWVPVKEQDSQGGLISSFYSKFRVLDGDAYWVSV